MSSFDLSRLQFAITALYHFLFVPLTLGLVIVITLMESVYVTTGKAIWKKITKFWGLLFGINFAMGVATGITMEFQFGTNWSYYAHYVGDIFGAPLALEGMIAFFFEATFIGLFFFGWDRLSKRGHLICTYVLAFGTSASAFWILTANGWMQHPVGTWFNPETMRMELLSLYKVIFSPTAQCKFVHTISAGYATGAVFVTAVSCYYLLRGREVDVALRSLWISVPFGLYAVCAVILLGDESGYTVGHSQKMKLAAMESIWRAEKPPASFTLVGFPNMKEKRTDYAIRIPYVMGLIATRSLDTPILGIEDLVDRGESRIRKGIVAYGALQAFRQDPSNYEAKSIVLRLQKYLGYGLLLKRHVPDVVSASETDIRRAAQDLVPNVPTIFWSFRFMVGSGLAMLAFFALALYAISWNRLGKFRWLLKTWPVLFPLPWVACSCGWIVAEHGRQPWAIDKILPTYLGASPLPPAFVWTTIAGFVLLYTVLLVVDAVLMTKYIRMGPDKALNHGAAAPASTTSVKGA